MTALVLSVIFSSILSASIWYDEALAKEVKIYRNYGSEKRYYNKVVGTNSRLDELQAGLSGQALFPSA